MAEKKEDGYVHFRCKACSKKLKIKSHYEGGNIVNCPRCRAVITVPLANVQALVREASDIIKSAARLRLDEMALLSELKAEPEAAGKQKAKRTQASEPWRPQAGLSRLQELDNFQSAIRRLDEEQAERMQRLFQQPNLSGRDIAREARRLREEREERVRYYVSTRRKELKQKLQELEAQERAPSEPARKRLEQLRRSLLALEAYSLILLGKA